jgi:hypothetical protein
MEVQILDDDKYGKALYLLHYQLGGMFWSLPTRRLILSPRQHEALVKAGLVEANGPGRTRRGKKKKEI